MFELVYATIAVVVGIARWQRATTHKERILAVVAAVFWPITYLSNEIASMGIIDAKQSTKGK